MSYGDEIIKNFTANTQERIKEYSTGKGIPVEQSIYELQRSEPWLFEQGRNPVVKTFTQKQVQDAGEKADNKARSLMLMSAKPLTYAQALIEVFRDNPDLAEAAVAIPSDLDE